MGFFFEATLLSHKHRKLVKQLLSLETKVARQANDVYCYLSSSSRYDKASMIVCAQIGFSFGAYCMLKASKELRKKLPKSTFEKEEDALIRMFVKQHRNICEIEDLANIFLRENCFSYRRKLEENWFITPYLEQADELIEECYTKI